MQPFALEPGFDYERTEHLSKRWEGTVREQQQDDGENGASTSGSGLHCSPPDKGEENS